jgi:TRAP-type C4-dicarboxylate transport system substrate-binding protein
MRTSWKSSVLAVGLAAFAAATFTLGASDAAEARTLKWAHVYETASPYHNWALWTAEEVKKRSNGELEIEVFPASSLGKESDINEGLTLGTVDIIYTGQLFAGNVYGPIAIGGSPYMFRDFDHWTAYRDSQLFQDLATGYREEAGHEVIAMTYYGERHVTSNKEITQPGDMAKLKIRVPDAPLYTMFPEAVGANPTPIAFAEVYLALQQGVVDAQENPLPTIQFKKLRGAEVHHPDRPHHRRPAHHRRAVDLGEPVGRREGYTRRRAAGGRGELHRRHREGRAGSGGLVP